MTPSDRGPVIQQRLQHLRDSVLSNLWVVHRHYCGQLCQCPQLSDWQASIIADAAAEIQRLTGELAQARRELREQDLEADRLTRELIQAQVELAQARAERNNLRRLQGFTRGACICRFGAPDVQTCECAYHADIRKRAESQQGLRAALAYLIGEWRKTGQTERAEWLLCADELEAALAAPGDETPP
jgi:DNA repair exonuclease SbcCD ATPase subunit